MNITSYYVTMKIVADNLKRWHFFVNWAFLCVCPWKVSFSMNHQTLPSFWISPCVLPQLPVKCVLKEDVVEVSGGGLAHVYSTLQFHFHWGSHDSDGSEHTVDSKRYPMEVVTSTELQLRWCCVNIVFQIHLAVAFVYHISCIVSLSRCT